MFINLAYAQVSADVSGASGVSGGGILEMIAPLAIILLIMYFLILRPQQKKIKDHQKLINNIHRGDMIVTSGGLIGKVVKAQDEKNIEVEIADNVTVKILRQMIANVVAKKDAKIKSDKTDIAKKS